MHSQRYRAAERQDAARCPGFEPLETPNGIGCAHCSGLPEDHGIARVSSARVDQAMLF